MDVWAFQTYGCFGLCGLSKLKTKQLHNNCFDLSLTNTRHTKPCCWVVKLGWYENLHRHRGISTAVGTQHYIFRHCLWLPLNSRGCICHNLLHCLISGQKPCSFQMFKAWQNFNSRETFLKLLWLGLEDKLDLLQAFLLTQSRPLLKSVVTLSRTFMTPVGWNPNLYEWLGVKPEILLDLSIRIWI